MTLGRPPLKKVERAAGDELGRQQMASEERTAVWAGLFVLFAGAILVAGIVVLGQRSQLFRKHYELRAEFDNVQGLSVGATVRVAGVIVGQVSAIQVSPNPQERKVIVFLSVERAYQPSIKGDSVASIRTLGMLGDKFVEISIGSASAPALAEQQMLISQEPVDIYEIADEGKLVVRRLNRVASSLEKILAEFERGHTFANLSRTSESLADIMAEVQQGQGALHTIIYDRDLKDLLTDLKQSSRSFRTLIDKALRTEGGLGEMLFGADFQKLGARLRQTGEAVGRIVEKIEKSESLLHALIYDPEEKKLLTEIRLTARRLDDVLKRAEGTQGTLGLLLNDPSVWESLERLLGNLERSKTLKFFISQSLSEAPPAAPPK